MKVDVLSPRGIARLPGELQPIDDLVQEIAVGPDETISAHLWLPGTGAERVGLEIVRLDTDMRRACGAIPVAGGLPVSAPLPAPPLIPPDPVDPEVGELRLQSAQLGNSIDIDFVATAAVYGMLADTPTILLWVRTIARRLPFRIVFRHAERSIDQDTTDAFPDDEDLPDVELVDTRVADVIEASRIRRRTTIEYPDGSTLVEEIFDPLDPAA